MTTIEKRMMQQTNEIVCDMIKRRNAVSLNTVHASVTEGTVSSRKLSIPSGRRKAKTLFSN